jgi:hypothetical protein
MYLHNLAIFDIRKNKCLEIIKEHSLNVRSIHIDPFEEFFVTGSTEGSIKAFTLPSLRCQENWQAVHSKQTFVRRPGVFEAPVSTYGVMQVYVTPEFMYSCGADGRLLRTHLSRLK